MPFTITRRTALTTALAATTFGVAASPAATAAPDREPTASESTAAKATGGGTGAVHVLGNEPGASTVLSYRRDPDGALTDLESSRTLGTGTGAGLGSQNSLVLDAGGRYLYAVNAGSDSITSFAVTDSGLRWLGVVPSGGHTPISISVHGDRAYVLNAGGEGNISGFTIRQGRLRPLDDSTWALSGTDTDPAQVSITPSGRQVVVTEKETRLLDVFALDHRGVPTARTSILSSGDTPFGFDFTRSGHLAVSEAGPSAASTYELFPYGLRTISASVGNTESAACWIVVTGDGRYAYTGNGDGSQSISGYSLARSGSLSLLDDDGRTGTAEGGVGDLALSADSDFLYARLADGTVGGYRVERGGGLSALAATPGIPESAAGIAAR